MAGKGDKQRPTDHEAYSANFDAIFGNKIRGRTYDQVIMDELESQPKQDLEQEENTGV
jgi:hypothetical protein